MGRLAFGTPDTFRKVVELGHARGLVGDRPLDVGQRLGVNVDHPVRLVEVAVGVADQQRADGAQHRLVLADAPQGRQQLARLVRRRLAFDERVRFFGQLRQGGC